MIKFVYLDRHWQNIKQQYLKELNDMWSKGNVVYQSESVERVICEHTHRKHSILVNSCTDAITLMLQASKIKKGSEVLCPAYSFFATASAISRAGLTPVFVDVDKNYHIDLKKAKHLITSKTTGLIFVSLFGNPMNYSEVMSFCIDNDIECFEDAAQSFGSIDINKIPSGKPGLCSALSFSPSKPSPAFAFCGAVCTDDDSVAERVRSIRYHAKGTNMQGHNTNVPSAIALQLYHSLKFSTITQARRHEIAKEYDKKLSQLDSKIKLPPRNNIHNWSKYVIQTNRRDELLEHLIKNNIDAKIHYDTIIPHEQIYVKNHHVVYPTALKLTKTSLSLPIDSWLETKEQKEVIDTIKDFYNE